MLTDRQIQAAIRNARADLTLNDGAKGKGEGSLRLRIRVGAKGITATWLAWWQQGGKPATKTMGRYPELSLAEARELAAKAVDTGKHGTPVPAETPTVERLFTAYIESMRKAGRSSADEVKGQLDRAAAVLGASKPAGDVTSGDVVKLLAAIDKRGARVMADRMRAYLSAAFNWGIAAANDYRAERRQDWGIKANPAAQVKRDTEANQARDRNLSAAELRTLWAALDGEGFADGTGAAIRLIICCGQRVRETMRLEGSEIDLDAGLWRMPAHKTKMKARQHVIPLPPQAIDVLRPLIAKRGKGYLFPARHGESELQLASSLGKAIRRWLKASGMKSFQARDLRRTWKSRAGDAGVDRETRDLIQQHARNDTGSRHYDHTDYLPQMRKGMDRWAAWLDANVLQANEDKMAA